jgi:hypothetical protein
MKEIILSSFKSTLKEVQFLNNLLEKENINKDELNKSLRQAQNLLFSSYSSLNIFAESVENYVSIGYKITPAAVKNKKKISKLEVKLIYNNLVELINTDIQKGVINLDEVLILENQTQFLGLLFITSTKNEDIKELNKCLSISTLSKSELLQTLKKYIKAILYFIQDIMLYDIFLIFDKPKIVYINEIKFTTNYKKKYIDKWVNCSVVFSDLLRNKRIDYWSEIFDLKLDSDHIERIEKHQENLFYKIVDSEVNIVFSDIGELNENQQVEQIEKELILIYGFFKGDLSKLTIKRLKELIKFSKPKKLILAYDELKKSNYYSAIEYLIYDSNYIRRYTNYFVASFFIKYIKTLEDSLKYIKRNEDLGQHNHNSIDSSKANNDARAINSLDLFSDVITSEIKREYIYNILEYFGAINSERKSMLTQRKKGVLRGVIEALREENILPQMSLEKLCNIIAHQINLELKSKLDWSNTSDDYHKKAKEYIKDNPLH